jgi:glutamate--cysteine ligase
MAVRAVDRLFERRVAGLVNSREQRLLARGSRGLERESLRVEPDGSIAQTAHPRGLGSALMNPHVTTDYAEALTELVTPTFDNNDALIGYLTQLHQFVYRKLDEELLWASSMPCVLHGESDVPIATYGTSHQARVKSIYRNGLRIRYGGVMQAISGVHFNYSLPVDFWPLYAEVCQSHDVGKDFISSRYFDLLRNYRRHGWLISYLFGASPAFCSSFMQGRTDDALELMGRDTLIGPEATSLRMSDIGYRNRTQADTPVSVNHIDEYLRDLRHATAQLHEPFAALGVKVDGEYRQLSPNLLQIENEYYSYVRPKRALRAGERTLHALARGGVEYLEVRALDNSVFDPVGVNSRKLCFLEAFMQMLLLRDSPPISATEEERIDSNHLLVARRGRERGLTLTRDGRATPMLKWARELLDSMQGICELLDSGIEERPYAAALAEQAAKLDDVDQTPSAQLLRELRDDDQCVSSLMLRYSAAHRAQVLAEPADPKRQDEFEQEAQESLDAQGRLEASQQGSFDDYLTTYLAS